MIVVIGKPLAAIIIVVLLGYGSHIAFGVAIALAQIGEFSFLLATLGRQLGVLPEAAMNAIVAGAIVSIALGVLCGVSLFRGLATAPSALWHGKLGR